MRVFVGFLIAVQIFFAVNNRLPTWFWFQELSINLSAYWGALHLLTIIVLLLFGTRWGIRWRLLWWVPLLGFVSLNVYQLSRFVSFPNRTANHSAHSLSILLADVKSPQADLERLRAEIESRGPDLVALTGATVDNLAALSVRALYPFMRELPDSHDGGVALYSRKPLGTEIRRDVGEGLPPVLEIDLPRSEQEAMRLVLFRGLPPIPRSEYARNRLLVRRLSTPLRHVEGPLVVLGNFNVTPFSGGYRRFRNAAELDDAREGQGVLRTWNAQNLLLRFALDHVLYRGFVVQEFERLSAGSGEHYPLFVRFGW